MEKQVLRSCWVWIVFVFRLDAGMVGGDLFVADGMIFIACVPSVFRVLSFDV